MNIRNHLNRLIKPFLIIGLLVLVAACGTNPVTGSREFQFVSLDEEVNIGKSQYMPAKQSQGGELEEYPELTAYIDDIGQRLAQYSHRPELPFEFVVLDNPVPNAWALPGGKIAINWGLLLEMQDEAELAAVIGHEITHATARHGAKSMERGLLLQAGMAGLMIGVGASDIDRGAGMAVLTGAAVGGQVINSKYGRSAELESDKYGIGYMVKLGYDPRAAIQLQETFVRLSEGRKSNFIEGLFATHPPSLERVEANRKTAAKYLGSPPIGGWKINREEYQAQIAPLHNLLKSNKELEKASHAFREGRNEDALRFIENAESIAPNYATVHNMKAIAYRRAGQSAAAERSANTAVNLRSDYFHFYEVRGVLARDRGEDQAAMADLEHAYSLLPTTLNATVLGELNIANGNTALGQRYLNMVQQ